MSDSTASAHDAAASTPEEPRGERSRRSDLAPAGLAERLGDLRLGRFSGIYLWAMFVVVFAIWIPDLFLSWTTAQSIASEQAITIILALGVIICMSAGQFDLSVGQNLGLGAAVCVYLITHGVSAPAAAAITILVCGLCGLVNALLVVVAGIDSFIATLGSSSILFALTQILTDNQWLGPTPPSFQTWVSYTPLGIPILVVYAVAAAIVVWYVVEHTPVGRRLCALGANPDTARLAGIPTRRYIIGSLLATGLIAGIAAVLLASKLGTISSNIGAPYLLPTYAACFLSATQVKPGRFNVWGTVIALYLLATGVKGLVLAGGSLWITDMFNGVALVTAVGLALALQRRKTAKAKRRTARVVSADK